MTNILMIIVAFLAIVTLIQVLRVSELMSAVHKLDVNEVNEKDNIFNSKMMFIVGGLFLISFVWQYFEWEHLLLPAASSDHGAIIDELMTFTMLLIIFVFFITHVLLFWYTYKYRKGKGNEDAYYFPHNNKLEIIWTVVPAIVLAVIIIQGLRSWNEQTDAASDEAILVELYSKQFDWTARYSGMDNTLGRFDYKLTTSKNQLGLLTTETIDAAIEEMEHGTSGIDSLESQLNNPGIILIPEEKEAKIVDLSRKERLIRLLYQMKARHDDALDAQAMDDIIQLDTLYLRVDQEYEFNFRSKDVIHSAYFPHFRAQMNTVPGMTTRFKFTPDITTKEMREIKNNEKFNYVLMCNKICGGAHYKMKMMVVVLEQEEYDSWMKGKMSTSTFKDTYFANESDETPEEENEDAVNEDAVIEDNDLTADSEAA
jgi:cytochrome c oxidase subunit 2